MAVAVGVGVSVVVEVLVGVNVQVAVLVGVSVRVNVAVEVLEGVKVRVKVDVGVRVAVDVRVGVRVAVGVRVGRLGGVGRGFPGRRVGVGEACEIIGVAEGWTGVGKTTCGVLVGLRIRVGGGPTGEGGIAAVCETVEVALGVAVGA